jgi:hypothetical protein
VENSPAKKGDSTMKTNLQVVTYKNVSEIGRAHPEIKNLTMAFHIPKGMSYDGILKNLQKKNIEGRVYRVGHFIWKPAENTNAKCACFEKVGDNAHCPRHGDKPQL